MNDYALRAGRNDLPVGRYDLLVGPQALPAGRYDVKMHDYACGRAALT